MGGAAAPKAAPKAKTPAKEPAPKSEPKERYDKPMTKGELMAEAIGLYEHPSDLDQFNDLVWSVDNGYRKGREAENINAIYDMIVKLKEARGGGPKKPAAKKNKDEMKK